MKKYLYSIVVVLLFVPSVSGQYKEYLKEYLIINSDTIRLIIEERIDSLAGVGHQSPIVGFNHEFSGYNENDFVRYWKIRNDSLFEVYSGLDDFKRNWNDILYIPAGELLGEIGITQLFLKEKGYVIRNGIVVETIMYDNSATVLSPLTESTDVLYEFLRENIHINKLNNCTRDMVYVKINRLDDKLRIQEAEFLRGCDEQTNQEILRVIKTIPQWSVIYLHGLKLNYYTVIPIDLRKI